MSYTLMQCGRQGVQSSLISLRLFTQRLCLHCKVLQHVMHWLVASNVPYPISSEDSFSICQLEQCCLCIGDLL